MVSLRRSTDFGKVLAFLGLLLYFVAEALTSAAARGGFTLCLMSLLFFGCAGGTLPLQTKRTIIGWLMLGFGLILMAVGLVWFLRGPIAWLEPASSGVAVVALVLMAAGMLWVAVSA